MIRHLILACLSSVLLIVPAFGQDQVRPDHQDDALFLIDRSKPYLYLAVDHIGPRTPLRDNEPKTGLWLHLKNNSRFSIVVIGSRPPLAPEEKSVWVEDEVVPNKPSTGIDSTASGIGYRRGQDDLTDIFLSPNGSESQVRGAEAGADGHLESSRSVRPHGYNEGFQPGAPFINVISPGDEISFSLPSDHIGPSWHLEIPFRFALKHQDKLRQPYSYVALFWEDLSEKDRATITKVPGNSPAQAHGSAAPDVGQTVASPH